jgi:hypothetical protein
VPVFAKNSRWRASDPQIANPDEFITFLPDVFLVNHRFAFYWYIPFFGISGFAVMLANHVADMIERRNAGSFSRSRRLLYFRGALF